VFLYYAAAAETTTTTTTTTTSTPGCAGHSAASEFITINVKKLTSLKLRVRTTYDNVRHLKQQKSFG